MSVRHLLPTHAELVGQALASFGGFDRARAIAGLEAPSIPHDPDVVTAALRGLARNGVRLDVTTLSTMGEALLVTACVDAFGGVSDAVAAAGLNAVPIQEPPRRPAPDVRPDVRREAGFAQPAISADGQVPTAQALEVLQQTAVTLGRVPAARDLPPDVARRLTSEYGSVRFAYLALRVHSADEAGATAADEPIARVSPEAFAATARLPGSAAQNRRNVEAARDEAAASARVASVTPAVSVVPALDGDQVASLFEELDARIDEGAAAAAAQLTTALTTALEAFVDEVTALARRHTLESLLPFTEVADEDERDDDDDDDEDDDEDDDTTVTSAEPAPLVEDSP